MFTLASGISGDMLLAGLTDVFQAHDQINSFFDKMMTSIDGIEANYTLEKITKNNISGSILKFSIGKDIKKSNVKELLILVDTLLDKLSLSEKAQNFVKKVYLYIAYLVLLWIINYIQFSPYL